MCRIAGMVNGGLSQSVIEKTVKAMCDLQKHGGPDDEGFYSDPELHLVLGNRRLSMVDLSPNGHQPMAFGERYTITFNGEIYNFKELRSQLQQAGYSFKSDSDTEVVLAAFAEWHTGSFSMLEGMFAFAILDSLENQLYLVRDSIGIKPLYYSITDEQLVFASEFRAFKAVDYRWETDTSWPILLMSYGHIPEPVTPFKQVRMLPKGHILKFNLVNHKVHFQSFRHYNFIGNNSDYFKVKSELRNLISASVNRQRIADAPVGIFLSGGLDSSIIASLANDRNKDKLSFLSLYFSEKEFSEKKYQDLMLSRIGIQGNQELLTENEFSLHFESILQSMDMPCSDGINTWFISRYARKLGIKAVLSGVGADELFGGYPSFSRINFACLLKKLPDCFFELFKNKKRKSLNRLPYLSLDGVKGLYLFLRGHFNMIEIARYLDADEQEVFKIIDENPVISEVNCANKKDVASWMEFNLYMKNQLLRDSDVMGMIHGVEIRVPFLDEKVVSYALSIDSNLKYDISVPKKLLIDIFSSDIPTQIWNRPKMGFSFPFHKWLATNQYAIEIMNENSKNRAYFERFRRGDLHWSQLLSLVIMQSRTYGS